MNKHAVLVWAALLQRRAFIGAVTLAALVAGLVLAVSVWEPAYEAEVPLMISPPRLGEEVASGFLPDVYHARAYQDLLTSSSVIGSVWNRLIEQGVWSSEAEIPQLDAFAERLRFETTTIDQTTRPVSFSPFIKLKAVAPDAELAQAYVDTWAEIGVNVAHRAGILSVRSAARRLATEQETYDENLTAVWQALAQEEAEYNLDVLRQELTERVTALADTLERRLAIEQRVQASRARYEAAQQRLAEEQQIVDLFHAPSDDVFWLLEAESGGTTGEVLEQVSGRGLLHQTINQVYVALRNSESDALLSLADAEASLAALDEQIVQLEREKRGLQEALAEHKRVQARLQVEADTLESVFRNVSRMRAFADVAMGLVGAEVEPDAAPFGITRLTGDVYVMEASGPVGKRARVLLLVFLAFAAAVAYVAAQALWPLYMETQPENTSAASKS